MLLGEHQPSLSFTDERDSERECLDLRSALRSQLKLTFQMEIKCKEERILEKIKQRENSGESRSDCP